MFSLELSKAVEEIKTRQSKRVLIQLPDGLKKQANEIVAHLQKETGAEILIWYSSCFGACDMPLGLTPLNIDLLIQWGHNRYNKTPDMW